jgi:hypothetical protein
MPSTVSPEASALVDVMRPVRSLCALRGDFTYLPDFAYLPDNMERFNEG